MREAVATGPVARKLPRPLDGLLRLFYLIKSQDLAVISLVPTMRLPATWSSGEVSHA